MDKRTILVSKLRALRAKKKQKQAAPGPAGLPPPADPSQPPSRPVYSGWDRLSRLRQIADRLEAFRSGDRERFARPAWMPKPAVIANPGEHRMADLPGSANLHPEEKSYLTGVVDPRVGKIRSGGNAFASDEKLAGIHDAVNKSAQNQPGFLPTKNELQAAGRAGQSVKGVYEEGSDTLSKHLDSPDLHQKFVEDHLTHPVFKKILEEHGSPLAFAWGLFSSIGSPQTKWEKHTRGATALLASWAENGFKTDRSTMDRVLSDTIGRTYEESSSRPWAEVYSMGDKQRKLKAAMKEIGPALDSYTSGVHDRSLLSKTGWKAKNFADSSHPAPYRDPHAVAIDYMMGLATNPNLPQLAASFASAMGYGTKKGGKRTEPKGDNPHLGTVADMIDSALRGSHGITTSIRDAAKMSPAQRNKELPLIPLHGVVESLVSEDARLSDPTYSQHMKHAFRVLKGAQEKIWSDPALGLAYKMAVTHAAETMPLKPGEKPWKPAQLQESVWSLVAAILSTRDLAGTTRIKNIADSLVHEAVRFNWDILGTLNNENVADELVRLGLTRGSVEAFRRDCEDAASRRGAKFSGRIRGLNTPGFESIGRRIQPGQNSGGGQGRAGLLKLIKEGRLSFDKTTHKASMTGSPRKEKLRRLASEIIRVRMGRGQEQRWNPELGPDQDPELSSMVGEYLKNPSDHGRALILADKLQDIEHPHAATWRWYLNHGLKAFSGASTRDTNQGDATRFHAGIRSEGVHDHGGERLSSLFRAAVTRSFMPHVSATRPAPGAGRVHPLKSAEAAMDEMNALGLLHYGLGNDAGRHSGYRLGPSYPVERASQLIEKAHYASQGEPGDFGRDEQNPNLNHWSWRKFNSGADAFRESHAQHLEPEPGNSGAFREKFARPKPAATPGQAMTVARSGNALALARAMSNTLTRLGVTPHKVSRAVHSDGMTARPAAIASVYQPSPPEQAVTAGAWSGLLTKSPGMVAFYSDPSGPDMMHRVEAPGPIGEFSRRLLAAGAGSHTIVPTRRGGVAYVYDEGGRMGDRLRASGLAVRSAPGRGAMVGGNTPAQGRSVQRDVIRDSENSLASPQASAV